MKNINFEQETIEAAEKIVESIPNMMRAIFLANRDVNFESDDKLSMQHYQLLNVVRDVGECTVNELKNILKLAQSTVSQHLSKLLKSGYIDLIIDQYDRRKTIVRITNDGIEILEKKKKEFIQKHCYYLELLDKEDRKKIVEAYEVISEITSKVIDILIKILVEI
ncbi:MAG TPA: MarR family winged helix-turn-helix transcriptional regulator [Ignavibacteriales bacterium]|nr:MarR family winged helix-turn-helix transcriptional regulator [Ignavibacteriales bacterium]